MTDTKHSPAPWELIADESPPDPKLPNHVRWEIEAADGAHIAQNWFGGNDWKTELANARVMVLTPEMLAVLKKVSKHFTHLDKHAWDTKPDDRKALAKEVRDIIKRAKGKTT